MGMSQWPPLCIHDLELDTCAVCLETDQDDRPCGCGAAYALLGMTRPPFKNGVCSNCGRGGPPTTHDGRHGATCGRCRARARVGIQATEIRAIRDFDLLPD